MHRVFVYGTLKQGHGNYQHFLGESTFIGKAQTIDSFLMADLGAFPALVNAEVDPALAAPAVGEVYEIDDDTLQQLDWLEGEGSLYHRKKCQTTEGETWVYVFAHSYNEPLVQIRDGVYNW